MSYACLTSEGVEQREAVLGVVRSLGIHVIDLVKIIEAEALDPRSLYPHVRAHMSSEGYRKVANAIVRHAAGGARQQ